MDPVTNSEGMSSFIRKSKLPESSSTQISAVPLRLVKLEECEEEFDETKRVAEFAFHDITSDPKSIQCSALVIHFHRGKKTYLFTALPLKDVVQPVRAENVNYEVFDEATYIGTFETSPRQLLEKAKRIPTGQKYDLLSNNSWVKVFLGLISPDLLNYLVKTKFPNESIRDINRFITNTMRVTSFTFTKLDECEEESDETKRDAHLAFHITEPYMLRPSRAGEDDAKSDLKDIQHWALVVHFPVENKTYLFEAREEYGHLQARRAAISLEDIQVLEKVMFFGTVKTSHKELLRKAKQVGTGEYHVLFNNWQTWLKEFLRLISPKLSMALKRQIRETKTKSFLDQLIMNIVRVCILVVGGVGTVTIVVIVGFMLGSRK